MSWPGRCRVVLHYVPLNLPGRAVMRTRNRVALGGHDVPKGDVRPRFASSHAHLPLATLRADEVLLYDNADPVMPHRAAAMLRDDELWNAERLPIWAAAAFARVAVQNP